MLKQRTNQNNVQQITNIDVDCMKNFLEVTETNGFEYHDFKFCARTGAVKIIVKYNKNIPTKDNYLKIRNKLINMADNVFKHNRQPLQIIVSPEKDIDLFRVDITGKL
mgnify:CR=1 FL=1